MDGRRDLLLFVATPVLIVPLVAAARQFWTAQSLYVVAMFGALGHHLPGMMRAYGDRELFRRFRTRFVVAPLALLGTCVASAFLDPSMAAVTLVTYVWGVWHGLMQTHGFLRIYDAKGASSGRWTAALDQWMCIAWFGAGIVFSTPSTHHVLQELAMAGGPVVGLDVVHGVRRVWGVLTALVTVAFLVHAVARTRAGRAPSPVKLLLLATSIGYWWYANRIVDNLLVGVLLFELFHDVQYLAIVWVFNRRRVESGARVDTFTRFVFRPRVALMLLYVACVGAYGALRLLPDLPSQALDQVLAAFVAASALLHFYYDSFIWKVKERSTRAGLGLEGGSVATAERGDGGVPVAGSPAWAPLALRWSVFGVPLVLLAIGFARGARTPVETMLALGREFPDYALAQHNLGVALAAGGRLDAAIATERRVLQLEREDRGLLDDVRRTLAGLLVDSARDHARRGRRDLAEALVGEAAALDPVAVRSAIGGAAPSPR